MEKVEFVFINKTGSDEDDAPIDIYLTITKDEKIIIKEVFVTSVEMLAPITQDLSNRLHELYSTYKAIKSAMSKVQN